MDRQLEFLRDDFKRVTGSAFSHFYCPILYQDEPTALCEGHIINKAFPGSNRATIIQRADVDNFYGRVFESEFVKLKHKGRRAFDFLSDPELKHSGRPEVFVDGEVVEYFVPKSDVPSQFVEVNIETANGFVPIALKINPDKFLPDANTKFEIEIKIKVWTPAIVSLLKAAHLTLFRLLGYQYVFSAGGRFLGNDILGSFYLKNRDLPKHSVLDNAREYFSEFVNMVRPVVADTSGFKGTLSDNSLFVCRSSTKKTWALIVFVRTGEELHSVVVPVMEGPDEVARFFDFLKNNGARFEAEFAIHKERQWHLDCKSIVVEWPGEPIELE
jgi:hypothetical protein